MEEEWRPVAWASDYEVSNLGQVRSVERFRRNKHGFIRCPSKVLKRIPDTTGYLSVRLYPEPGRKNMQYAAVHVLVARAFVAPYDGPEVAHLDHDKANPVASNLEWLTHRENMAMSVVAGVFHKATNPKRARKN